MTIYGRIKKETEKAVLIHVAQDNLDAPELNGCDVWFPLSQAMPLYRAMGPLDAVSASEWIVAKKIEQLAA